MEGKAEEFEEKSAVGGDADAELSLEELQQNLQQIQLSNSLFRKENNLLESYLRRVSALNTLAEAFEVVGLNNTDAEGEKYYLTAEQKLFIAENELREAKEEIEKSKESSDKILEQLRSLREETEIRIAEMKKEAYEFRRDIVAGSIHQQTGKIMAERIEKYFQDKIKQKDILIEKLKIKNATLKNQCIKIESQLQHKEELGDVFLPIDFDQLKIENQQYLEKIEERNAELLKLKVTAGHTLRILSHHKKRLHSLSAEHDKLQSEIKSKEDSLARLVEETHRVIEERNAAEKINKKLKQQLEEYRVPQVLEYIKLNAELHDIHKKIKDWERKIEIAHMAIKKQKSTSVAKQSFTSSINYNR